MALIYLFDRYVFDEPNFCLMRDGQRLPLEPKAVAVLSLMVRSEGRLLKKETLLEAVWKNAVVEESSLSRAVALLRKQLGDDPRRPTFIETVPTLGYRFIAAVTTAEAAAGPVGSVDRARGGDATEVALIAAGSAGAAVRFAVDAPAAGPAAVEPVAGGALGPVSERRYARRAGAALLLLGAVAATWFVLAHRPHPLEKKILVLAEFENTTEDPVFDGTLRQGLTVQLDQSPLLGIVPEQRIQATLRLMGQEGTARLTPALGRQVCQRAGAAMVLDGSIARLGEQYVLGLRAIDCRSGNAVDTEQEAVARKEDVLRALGDMASRFRSRAGESVASVARLDTPLEEATTPSLEALQAFSQAVRMQNAKGSGAAVSLFQQAIALDPEFALAHAMLGRMYGDLGQELRSAESTAAAYRYRSRASERERFFIVAAYETQVTGNLEKAEQTCEVWNRMYPDDAGGFGFPAGLILRVFGRYEEAADKMATLMRSDLDFAMGYHLLVINEMALGRYDEAHAALDAAAARHFEIPQYVLDRHRLAFLQGDRAAMARLSASAARQPATEGFLAGEVAAAWAYDGKLGQSRDAAQRGITLALQLDRRDVAARLEAASAIHEALSGNAAAAAGHATAALALSNGRDAEYGAALAFGLAAQPDAAQRLADDLERRFPEDTAARFHYLPAVRAVVALGRGDPAQALEQLRVNVPYELGTPPSNFTGYYGVLYPVFLRGRAYVAAHRGRDAAMEFQKIIDHPELVVSDSVGALAHLELGRALAAAGDRAAARLAYAAFLDLWKGADADLPMLVAAKEEYARL